MKLNTCARVLLLVLTVASARGQTVSLSTTAAAPVARTATTNALPFEKEILAYETADRTNAPAAGGMLFIGSSSIRLWKTLAADFPKLPVFNRGFGGSQIIDSVRYAERIVLPYQPSLVVLYAGGNDINAGKTPEQVFADYRAFIGKVHAALPATRIAYISFAPNPARWTQVERVRTANKLIEAHTRTDARLAFIDVYSKMLGDDGQPRPEIFVADRLHMNAEGYKLWRGIVGPVLERWPKNEPK